MGIGLKNRSWGPVVGEWYKKQQCSKKSDDPHCCDYHYWQKNGEKFETGDNLKPISDHFAKWLDTHKKKKDIDTEKEIVSTDRGKRRRAKLDKQKG